MATVRCPSCGEEIIPLPVERGEEGPTQYVCPSCRHPLTLDVVDHYLALEEEEASG
jgi:DNA-directed RNA polymerase subunit RPC12/RpoP